MADGDIYQLKDFQRHGGQEVSDVYTYRQIGGGGGAEELVAAYVAQALPEIITVQNNNLTHVQIEAQNIADVLDFFTLPLTPPVAGADTGNYFATFAAWGFKKPRNRTDIRNGSFRIAGVTSSLVADGSPTAGALAELNALAESLGTDLLGDGDDKWQFGYMALPSGLMARIFIPTPTLAFTRLTTQNSRKVGVGQ